jgi:hypothetical protein
MKIDGAVAVLGICMAASLFGTPHLLYEYECEGYDIRHCAYYTSCTYIGCRDGVNPNQDPCQPRIVRR